MKNSPKSLLVASVFLFLAACGKKDEVTEETAVPPIPNMTVNQIVKMTKNERQELERRCLGVSHETCTNLKSDEFEKSKAFDLALCRASASMTGLTDRYAGRVEEKKCDDLF